MKAQSSGDPLVWKIAIVGEVGSPFASKVYVPVVALKFFVSLTALTTCARVGMLPPFASMARPIASMRILAQSYAGKVYEPTSSFLGKRFVNASMVALASGFWFASAAATVPYMFAALSAASLMHWEFTPPSGTMYGTSRMPFICARGMQILVPLVAPA